MKRLRNAVLEDVVVQIYLSGLRNLLRSIEALETHFVYWEARISCQVEVVIRVPE